MSAAEKKPEKEISIQDFIIKSVRIFRYILSKWIVIFITAFLFGVIGILYAWFTKPIYVAEMSFVTESDNGSKLGGYASIAAQFGFDLGGGNNSVFEGDNLVELLKSSNMVQKTLLTRFSNKEFVIEDYLRNAGYYESKNADQLKSIRFDGPGESRIRDSIIQMVTTSIIKNDLNIFKKDKKLSLIVIQMKSGNEEFSKRFVELLADNAIQYYSDYKSRKARQNVQILERKVDSVRSMLFGNISEVASITDLNVNPIKQSVRSGAQRKQVDVQVNGVLYTELLKNLEMAKIVLSKETPLIQIIDSPMYPLEKKKPGRLRTGITFALLGGFLAIFYFLARRWIKNQNILFSSPNN